MAEDPQGQIHQAVTEIRVMAERFNTMNATMTSFIADMKEYQANASHQARQDYEYLDTKIDRRSSESESIARDALKKVDDHILLTKRDETHGRKTAEWVKWILPVVVTIALALFNFMR